MRTVYRGLSKDVSYQVFDSFGKAASEKKIFLEINQSETRIVCCGHVC
jgi:hypothetical protein